MKNLSFFYRAKRSGYAALALTAALLGLGSPAAQAQYCSNTGGACGTADIGGVSIAGTTLAANPPCIAIPGFPPNGYHDYTAASNPPSFRATLQGGVVYQINCGNATAVWIDWDRDTNFDASEFAAPNPSTRIASYVLPGTASQGASRIRFRSAISSPNGACTPLGFGETNDYAITIAPPVACPVASAVAVGSITNTSASLNFTPRRQRHFLHRDADPGWWVAPNHYGHHRSHRLAEP